MKLRKPKKAKGHCPPYQAINRIMRLIFFFTLAWNVAIAQTSEVQIIKEITNDIVRNQNGYLVQNRLKGVYLVSNPIDGQEDVWIDPKEAHFVDEGFKKLSKSEKIGILKSSNYKLNLTDTLFIIDSLKVLQVERHNFSGQKIIVEVRREVGQKEIRKCIKLDNVQIRDNELIFWIVPLGQDLIYMLYYFDISNGNLKLTKSKQLSLP